MRIPRMAAQVERRLLVNWRVDPDVAAGLLPVGLRPQVVDGSAVAGICLIRLGAFRPTWFAPRIGWGGENAAHRIAVEWDQDGATRTGVYIPRRHSASRIARLAGGRVFPGTHDGARFSVAESTTHLEVALDGADIRVLVDVETTDEWTGTLFPDRAAASAFFRKDSVGFSPARSGALEGLRLDTDAWAVSGARPVRIESSWIGALPAGSATLDFVLLMRDVPVIWSSVPDRSVPGAAGAPYSSRSRS